MSEGKLPSIADGVAKLQKSCDAVRDAKTVGEMLTALKAVRADVMWLENLMPMNIGTEPQ